MDLSKAKKVVELSRADDVNRYLDVGWVLLNTFISCYGPDQTLKYVLGWIGDNPVIPESPYPQIDWEAKLKRASDIENPFEV